jgi:hypothetical protein
MSKPAAWTKPTDPWAVIPGADRITASVSIIQAKELNGDPNAIDAFARVWIGKRKMKRITQIYQNSYVPFFFPFFSFYFFFFFFFFSFLFFSSLLFSFSPPLLFAWVVMDVF